MGGSSPPNSNNRQKNTGAAKPQGDKCDIELDVDLIGIDPAQLVGLTKGTVLAVQLKTVGSTKSAVVVGSAGGVVGSLAAVRGLSQLLRCMEDGVNYQATVQSISKTGCNVSVQRV